METTPFVYIQPAVTQAQLDSSIANIVSMIPPTQFVQAGMMTVSSLLSTYPASATYLGKYARVSDLWGSTDEIMRCSSDGNTYFWRPQRSDYAVTNTQTSGALPLVPLVTPPQVFLTGTLLGNMTVTPSATNAWPGATFDVNASGALGLFGISLAGLIGGTVPLLSGSTKTLIYTSAGWRAS